MLRQRRLAVLLVILAVAGCGPRTIALHGAVTLDDQPVAGPGTVAFYPEAGNELGVSGEIVDGKYEIPAERGPVAGKYRVEITWPKKTGKQIPSLDPGMMSDETIEAIPKKYNRDSELTVEISSSQSVHDFHLKSR